MGLLILQPILGQFVSASILINIFMTAIGVSMVRTITHEKSHFIAGVILVIVILASL